MLYYPEEVESRVPFESSEQHFVELGSLNRAVC